MTKVHYSSCPVCNGSAIAPLFKVKDYTVSGEQFDIWQCADCTLRFTQDVPDESSIAPYYKAEDYISHTDRSKGIITKLYKKVRAITLAQKAALIQKETELTTGKLIDIGCGTGAFLHTMKNRGWEVTGLEPDGEASSVAKKLYGIEPLPSDQLFHLEKASYHAITLWHVLEHVHPLHHYIEQLKNLLAEGGKIFIAVPNYTSLDAEVYRLHWAAYDVPRHLYHFTPKAIESLVAQHGLKVAKKQPMWFDAFYISMLSSRYRNGKTAWIGSLVSGVRSNLKTLTDHSKCSSLIYVIEKV